MPMESRLIYRQPDDIIKLLLEEGGWSGLFSQNLKDKALIS